MDVGNPSNFERVHALYDGDVARLRRDVAGRAFDDDATRQRMAQTFRRRGYVLDPHSAVGMLGLEAELTAHPRANGVLLATAHPAKFADAVEPEVGCGVAAPPALARLAQLESRYATIEPRLDALAPHLP
jgi:threonine synthase